jgi:hypothetical protein
MNSLQVSRSDPYIRIGLSSNELGLLLPGDAGLFRNELKTDDCQKEVADIVRKSIASKEQLKLEPDATQSLSGKNIDPVNPSLGYHLQFPLCHFSKRDSKHRYIVDTALSIGFDPRKFLGKKHWPRDPYQKDKPPHPG